MSPLLCLFSCLVHWLRSYRVYKDVPVGLKIIFLRSIFSGSCGIEPLSVHFNQCDVTQSGNLGDLVRILV